MTSTLHPFDRLTPDFIMDAVESRGGICDCRIIPLNSYENRVYQVGLEEKEPVIAKFYRPERWTREQIYEEHAFCLELAEQELPVVAPLAGPDGETIYEYEGFYIALFPRKGGHAPEFDNDNNLLIIGRLLGRLHRVGQAKPFKHRPAIDIVSYGHEAVELIRNRYIPADYRASYEGVTSELLNQIEAVFSETPFSHIRLHGDFHSGNMLWRDDNPHFVDFDDARLGPAVQDIWMLLSGDRLRQTRQLDIILEGYEQFNSFDPRELRLIESLRTLRMLHYSAWLGLRWDDPAFPAAFPWFNSVQYWGEQIIQLREQLGALQELPLSV